MNKSTLKIILIAAALTGNANGTQFISPKGNDSVIINEYNDDVCLTGNTIRFDGKVRGDLYAACNELVQSDTIEGNLDVACKSIQSLGPVGRSLTAFAYSISCNAPIGRNLMGFAKQIVIGPDVIIGMDANLFAGSVVFQGDVKGKLKIRSSNATFSGKVAGDLQFAGDSLIISSDAVIGGDLIYCSPSRAEIGKLATIGGEIKWTECERDEKDRGTSAGHVFMWLASQRGYFLALTVFSLIFFIFSAIPFPAFLSVIGLSISFLLSGNIFILLSKNVSLKTEKVLNKKMFPSIGVGFAVLLLSPFATLILLLTIFGAPLGAILILTLGIACFAGCVYASLFLGRKICLFLGIGSQTSTGYGCYSIGIIIVMLLSLIPVIGYILAMLVTMMGLGGLVLAVFGGKDDDALIKPSN